MSSSRQKLPQRGDHRTPAYLAGWSLAPVFILWILAAAFGEFGWTWVIAGVVTYIVILGVALGARSGGQALFERLARNTEEPSNKGESSSNLPKETDAGMDGNSES